MEGCIAMVLAGGKGTRLGGLTSKLAKPAVPFGGKYRIINFTLSNCIHSGLSHIGVVTQYEPLILHSHIKRGSWGEAEVALLPSKQVQGGEGFYTGTADAIYQNIAYIEQFAPKHVLVLSGDHIYRMDYHSMLQFHLENEADVTISVLEVPHAETSRFGIMKVDEESRILEFQEKPKQTDSNLASMGIYLFRWAILKRALLENTVIAPYVKIGAHAQIKGCKENIPLLTKHVQPLRQQKRSM